MKELVLIGRAEKVEFPQLGVATVPAKIDTGADTSSIWAHKIQKVGDNLLVSFFGPESDYYAEREHIFSTDQYSLTRVTSSFGHKEIRYKVKLKIRIKGRLINGSFNLADRSSKLYPVLIGRRLLLNKFIVDVSKGKPLLEEEKTFKTACHDEIIASGKDI